MLPYTATQQGVQEIKGRKVGLRGGSGPAHLGNDWSWGPCHTEPGWLIKTEKLVNSACLDHEVTKEKSVSRPSKKKKKTTWFRRYRKSTREWRNIPFQCREAKQMMPPQVN